MYCGLDFREVEVIAVTQPLDEESYYDNVVSIKKLTDEKIPENEEQLLLITIPKAEWNGKYFDLYLYE